MSPVPVWPATKLGEALYALASHDSRIPRTSDGPVPLPPALDDRALDLFLEQCAVRLGLECTPMAVQYAQFERQTRFAGPAILQMPNGSFLVLLRNGAVLSSDLASTKIAPDTLRTALFSDAEVPAAEKVGRALRESGLRARRQEKVRAAVLRDLLAGVQPAKGWQLRESPGASFAGLARAAGIHKDLGALAAAHAAQYLLWIAAWWLIGQSVLRGRIDQGALWAWALVLLTSIPLRVLTTWLQGRISIGAGGLLKERLLFGALRLETEETRHQGAGQLLGRVLESESLESLALSGGFLAVVAVLELVVAGVVLSLGAGGVLHVGVFAIWVALTVLMGWRYFRHAEAWTEARLNMTNDLVERMVGHRTRLAQEPVTRWHRGEDAALAHYLETSHGMDRATAILLAVAPRAWLTLGILCLAPAFVAGSTSAASLAVGIGANLLAYRALRRVVSGLRYVAGAAIAWEQVAPLFRAAERRVPAGSPAVAVSRSSQEHEHPILDAQDLVFRYGHREEPTLRGCSLRVSRGERIVLEGPSGAGKSTLASLVAGLRRPDAGLLLVGGWDRSTLGTAGWRRLVAFAPQFHENHVLTGTFLLNALMGRPGLVTQGAEREAEQVCRELGLGALLSRMPSGMLQMVGESGWQLSHGERSRLFIARALLQGAELVVLDESFAALDPENLRLALECVNRRAESVLAIGHE